MYHKTYDGPRPITYVDTTRHTRLFQGGPNDYIEAFNNEEVMIWLRVIRDLLDAHHIPRQNVLKKTWSCPRRSAAVCSGGRRRRRNLL
jgi:hypothetical protein